MEHKISRDVTVTTGKYDFVYTVESKVTHGEGKVKLFRHEIKSLYELAFPPKEDEMEEEPVEERCDVCVFWLRYSKTEHGPCRRYPPTSISSLTMTHQKTASDNWCGEFQPK